MEWWERVVLPMRIVWIGVVKRLRAKKTDLLWFCRIGEIEAGGEHVRIRGRARDVGDAKQDGNAFRGAFSGEEERVDRDLWLGSV
ncbi:hypothetical protein J5N97_010359 [Dioscorea zingiberensis]|uniref:Uncharacterized protein n=1 Tax=Dioscorea zingiberensis TaxID=325984 RepID=A0A9D5D023_9LILI|nr:hypothetical protein J5N97_010359 [Dioscorea zingiberensis]